MPTITLTVGLPGCGKTTWAVQEIKKAKSKTININRDDIRESMAGSHDAYKFNDANEKYVTNLQFSAAKLAAENGWNIIVSDTNLKPHFREQWKMWAKDNGYDYKEKNFYDDFVPKEDRGADVHEFFKIKEFVKLCKKYNLQRERSVQDNIIDTMADTYYYSKALHIGYYGNSREEAIIVDIDGTLAHKWNRNPFD
ncbi:AAA family ATPase, partial [Escherichia coli]